MAPKANGSLIRWGEIFTHRWVVLASSLKSPVARPAVRSIFLRLGISVGSGCLADPDPRPGTEHAQQILLTLGELVVHGGGEQVDGPLVALLTLGAAARGEGGGRQGLFQTRLTCQRWQGKGGCLHILQWRYLLRCFCLLGSDLLGGALSRQRPSRR